MANQTTRTKSDQSRTKFFENLGQIGANLESNPTLLTYYLIVIDDFVFVIPDRTSLATKKMHLRIKADYLSLNCPKLDSFDEFLYQLLVQIFVDFFTNI